MLTVGELQTRIDNFLHRKGVQFPELEKPQGTSLAEADIFIYVRPDAQAS